MSQKAQLTSIKDIERYVKAFEDRHRRHVEEQKRLREEAIRHYIDHIFFLGIFRGSCETDATIEFSQQVEKLAKKYGSTFRVVVIDDVVLALPVNNYRVSFTVDLKEIVKKFKKSSSLDLFT